MERFNLNSPEMTKLLKDVFLPAFEVETFNNAGALSEAFGVMKIGSTTNAPTGKLDAYFKKGRNGSYGAFTDDYTFDTATMKPAGDEAVIRTRGFQANARIDIVPNSRMNSGSAWENIFDDQFTDLTKGMQKSFGRMLYGDGEGVITEVKTLVPATAKGVAAAIEVKDVRPFEIGDMISIVETGLTASGNVAGPYKGIERVAADQVEKSEQRWANHGSQEFVKTTDADFGVRTFQVVDIDDLTGKIIVLPEDGEAVAANKYAANAKIYQRRSIGADIHGLEYIIGDGEYFGLNDNLADKDAVASKRPAYLKSYTDTVASAEKVLTESKFMKAIDTIELRGTKLPDLLVTSRATRRSIASSNQGATTGILRLTRDAGATAANDQRSLGYQGVDLRGQEIEVDRFCPKGSLYFIDLTRFDMAVESELQFDDYDGIMWKQIRIADGSATGYKNTKAQLSYEANMYAYKELFHWSPRALGKITWEDAPVSSAMDVSKFTVEEKELGQA